MSWVSALFLFFFFLSPQASNSFSLFLTLSWRPCFLSRRGDRSNQRRPAATLTPPCPSPAPAVFPPEAVATAGPAPEPGSPAPLAPPRAWAQKWYHLLLSIISIARLHCESSHRQTVGSNLSSSKRKKNKTKNTPLLKQVKRYGRCLDRKRQAHKVSRSQADVIM